MKDFKCYLNKGVKRASMLSTYGLPPEAHSANVGHLRMCAISSFAGRCNRFFYT